MSSIETQQLTVKAPNKFERAYLEPQANAVTAGR
jgi:hypothetical protein